MAGLGPPWFQSFFSPPSSLYSEETFPFLRPRLISRINSVRLLRYPTLCKYGHGYFPAEFCGFTLPCHCFTRYLSPHQPATVSQGSAVHWGQWLPVPQWLWRCQGMFGWRQQRTLRPGDANVTWMKWDGRQIVLIILGPFWRTLIVLESTFAMFLGPNHSSGAEVTEYGRPT